MSRPRIAIIGGGIAGVTAAWQLARQGAQDVTLFESSSRFGGTVETIRREGFIVETGPDGWVTEKPWAQELAVELGLDDEIIHSNDATRVTYILHNDRLEAMPDGMRMMVPTDFAALDRSPIFSAEARLAYAAEPGRARQLQQSAPTQDESVSNFVLRHFGSEVLQKVAAPLLSGVFGGDVAKLSVRAVMPSFVQLEREYGSLITGLQAAASRRGNTAPPPIFTSLRSGVGTLVERMLEQIPAAWLHPDTPVTALHTTPSGGWTVHTAEQTHSFDQVLLAVPAHAASPLLSSFSRQAADLLDLHESSAIIVAFAWTQDFPLPAGFGFLVPPREHSTLLAGTFIDQKYPHRVPPGCRLIRAFFGGEAEPAHDPRLDPQLANIALHELQTILGSLPEPAFRLVRRWPRSLPQYTVGHQERMRKLAAITAKTPGLHLLGNPYHGVGLPDLIRDARAAARSIQL